MPNAQVSIIKPAVIGVPLNSPKTITGLSLSDADAGIPGEIYIVSLMPAHGTLSLSSEDGVTVYPEPIIGTVDMGDLDEDIFSAPPPGSLFFGGTFAAVNAALATLIFTPETGYTGTGEIEMMVSDHPEQTGPETWGPRTSDYEIIALSIGINQAPAIANLGGDTVAYVEEALPVYVDLDGDALVTDDNANFSGGTLTIAILNRDTGEDMLLFDDSVVSFNENDNGNYDVIVDGVAIGEMPLEYGTPVDDLAISLYSEATAARISMLLSAVTYNNLDFVDPTEGTRTIEYTLTDGSGPDALTTTVQSFIAVTDTLEINREALLDLDSGTAGTDVTRSYTEGAAAIALAPSATTNDPDLLPYNGGSLTVAVDAPGAGDQLTLVGGAGVTLIAPNMIDVGGSGIIASYTGGANGSPLVITFLPVGSVATTPEHVVDDIVRAIRYRSTSEAPAATRTVTFTLNDGGGTEFGGDDITVRTATVNVIAINDAPSGTSADGPDILENGTLTLTVADFGFSDIDGNALSEVVITNVTGGLLYVDENGDGIGDSGEATLSATVTVAQITDGKVWFAPTPDVQGENIATISFRVRDDGGTANGGVDTDPSTNVLTIDVVVPNVAPTVAIDSPVSGFGPAGGEILVNTATEASQQGPRITALSNGGFVVIWRDLSLGVGGATGDGSSYAVKAQVFAADGALVGTEILVNTATPNFQIEGQITALSNGGFVVTWKDGSQGVGGATGDTSDYAIKAQVFAADGTTVGSEVLVNTAVAGAQQAPQITALQDGGFVVTWADSSLGVGGATGDGSTYAVKAQVFAADGTPVGTEILVNTATANEQFVAQVTAQSNGGFVVTWIDLSLGIGGATGDGSGSAVKMQLFAADGTPVGSEILVNAATAGNQLNPQSTELSNGGFVVTWQDLSLGVGGATGDGSGSAVKAQVFAADGTTVGTEIRVNTATANAQQTPLITALPDGGFVVTWLDGSLGVGGATGDGSSVAIKAQVFAADGTTVGTEILVNTATANAQQTHQITALPDGGFVVSWADLSLGVGGATGDTSDYAIKAQAFSANGTPVGTEILVNTATVNAQQNAQITALPDGGFVVTWTDNSLGVGGATGDTSGTAIKAQVFAANSGALAATEQAALDLKGTITVADVDAGGADVTLTLSVDYGMLTVAAGGSGADVSGSGTNTVTITGTLAEITALLDTDATSSVAYTPDTDAPPASAQLTVTVDDGGNTGSGGAQTGIESATIAITAVNDAPVLTVQDIAVSGTEDINLVFNAAGANAITVADPDGPLDLTISVLNGTLTLSQTTGLSFSVGDGNSNATMTFSGSAADINAALEGLIYRGALNYEGADTLSITLDDGPTTLSSDIAITLADYGAIDGTSGNDNPLSGTALSDLFDLSQGGEDTATGLDGNDGFYMGAALSALDNLDGGAGADDQLGLQGNYGSSGTPFVLAATHLVNIETLVLLSGSDTRFGDTSGNTYDYYLKTVDANVGALKQLTVNFNKLGPSESVFFDGSAESDGWFFTMGGLGADTLIGGDLNDGFYFGNNGRWGAGDSVTGGGGDDQLGLQGSYIVTFGATQMSGIETLVLMTGGDARVGNPPGIGYSYDLTMDDGNVAGLETMVVNANRLRANVSGVTDETLMFNGAAELDGHFTFYGGAAADTFIGGAQSDSLWGALGGDTLIGNGGADTFGYTSALQSRIGGFDTLVDFNDAEDRIDLPNGVSISSFATATTAALSEASMAATLEGAHGTLALGQAVVFTADGGDMDDRVFLLINTNGTAGFQAAGDFVIELVNPTPIDNLGMFI